MPMHADSRADTHYTYTHWIATKKHQQTEENMIKLNGVVVIVEKTIYDYNLWRCGMRCKESIVGGVAISTQWMNEMS